MTWLSCVYLALVLANNWLSFWSDTMTHTTVAGAPIHRHGVTEDVCTGCALDNGVVLLQAKVSFPLKKKTRAFFAGLSPQCVYVLYIYYTINGTEYLTELRILSIPRMDGWRRRDEEEEGER